MSKSTQSASSRKSSKKCVYCGAPATTKDHTPPRALLRKPLPNHAVTVSACQKCNVGFSGDESLFKVVLGYSSSHPDLVADTSAGGSIARALARDPVLRAKYEAALQDGKLWLSGELLESIRSVILKTVQGLYFATFASLVPKEKLELVCLQAKNDFTLEDLVEWARPTQVLDITDELLPEITPSGWARKGQAVVVTTPIAPAGGGSIAECASVFWLKQETPVDWIDYQEGIFKFGFVGTPDKKVVCAIELWQTLVVGVSAPWPTGRGTLRRGRNNPFSRERRTPIRTPKSLEEKR